MITENMRRSLYFFLILFILTGCSDDSKSAKNRKSAPHPVEVVTLNRAPLQSVRTLSGSLEASNTVHIYNEELGKITQLPFHPGDRVEKDALLAVLDDTIIQAEYDKARATYEQAKLNYQRIVKLIPKKLASDDELARARTSVDEARAERDLLQARLNHTRILAPFNGVISERMKEPGDVLPLHTHVLTLFDPDSLIIKLHISEILLANIQEQDAVRIRIDALGDQQFSGFISRKYPTINPVTRQGTIEVSLKPVPAGALPGQLARVTIETQTPPLRTLPLGVVRHDARGEFVYRVDSENRVEHVPVRTGIQMGGVIEILEGLQDGDRIVSKGFLGLRTGKTVKVVNSDPTT